MHVRDTRSADALATFVGRLRVYSISDQDDAGPWIRRAFPALFYIAKPSSPDGGEYASATWTGISGDRFYRNGEGADFTTVSNEWLEANIRAKGPMGAHYPRFAFIMEGDTPSFLGVIPNGLQTVEHPNWGGWGGRYILRQPYGESRPLWTQGGDAFPRVTSADSVDGHVSDQATIWRWRTAFQHDFAARMDWTIQPWARANHPPVVQVNGVPGIEPLQLDVNAGETVTLDASGTRDPDGQALTLSLVQLRRGRLHPRRWAGRRRRGRKRNAARTRDGARQLSPRLAALPSLSRDRGGARDPRGHRWRRASAHPLSARRPYRASVRRQSLNPSSDSRSWSMSPRLDDSCLVT